MILTASLFGLEGLHCHTDYSDGVTVVVSGGGYHFFYKVSIVLQNPQEGRTASHMPLPPIC